MVPFAEEGRAEFGEDAVAEVADRRGNDAQEDFEEAKSGQACDDFADGGAAHEEFFITVGAAFDEDDGIDFGEFGLGLRELGKGAALPGTVAHAVLVIGEFDAVDPAIAEGALAVVKEEEGMALGGEGERFWGLGERAHAD